MPSIFKDTLDAYSGQIQKIMCFLIKQYSINDKITKSTFFLEWEKFVYVFQIIQMINISIIVQQKTRKIVSKKQEKLSVPNLQFGSGDAEIILGHSIKGA